MKSYAKINLFLKIVGTRGNYHEILSRFVLFEELYDEIDFVPNDGFYLESNAQIEQNIILKAKDTLSNAGYKNALDEYFSQHKIVLVKNIPMGAGLGGGSSNAAAFLNLANSELNLKISREKLMQIGASIGADVPFFLSEFKSANVSGIGEVIDEFGDEIPDFSLLTPQIFCDTARVYSKFRSDFISTINADFAKTLLKLKASELFKFKNHELNDLLAPCLALYPQLEPFCEGRFLSGSGSSVFSPKGL